LNKEIWKTIEDFPDYQVSNLGNIRSLKWNKVKSIKTHQDSRGYVFVGFFQDKKKYTRMVHRLVGMAFLPKVANKTQINHKDLNKFNNHYTNLEWSTQKENVHHAMKNNHRSVELCPVVCIETGEVFASHTEAAKKYHLQRSHVGEVVNGIRKTTGGYTFRSVNE
jgi:hypothetical protein